MPAYQLDDILTVLDRNRQRATYSAVAALTGDSPRTLMKGKPRAPGSSWVVSKMTGVPTGYTDADVHPQLRSNEKVIMSHEELSEWLAQHQ